MAEIDFSYKEDIVATRKGGFGSSDAEMILKLAEGGELSGENMKRIAEMLGLKEHVDFSNWRIARGNEYEQYAYEAMKLAMPQAVSNPYYCSEAISKEFGFNIFNHIDMEVETETELRWFEMKTSSYEVAEVIHKYNPQFAWHWMLLSEKAKDLGKKPSLYLLYHPMDQLFDIDLLRCVKIEEIRANFAAGFERMKAILKDFQWHPENDPMALIPTEMAEGIRILDNKLRQLKELEEYVEKEREALLDNMAKYCVPKGITTLPTEHYKIIYVGKSVKEIPTFHLDKLKNDHPEIVEKYTKQVTTEFFDVDLMKMENQDLVEEYTEVVKKEKNPYIQIR